MPDISTTTTVLSIVSGLVVGFFIGMTGIGGGVLVLPTLMLVLKVDPVTSLGTALFYALMAKVAAVISHARLGNVRWREAGWTIVGVVPSIIVASWVIIELKRSYTEATQIGVRIAAAGVILVSFSLMAWDTFAQRKKEGEGEGPTESGSATTPHLPLKGIGLGVLLGVLMGATSIGGGVLMLPLLIAGFGLAPRQAVGSSTFISLIAAIFGAIVYQRGGELNAPIAIAMFLGSLPGVWLGARAATKLSAHKLRICVLAVMAIAAVMLFFKSAGGGH